MEESVFVRVKVLPLYDTVLTGCAVLSMIILSLILLTVTLPLPSKFTEVALPSVPVSFNFFVFATPVSSTVNTYCVSLASKEVKSTYAFTAFADGTES